MSGDYTTETVIETFTEMELHNCTDQELEQFYEIKDVDKAQYNRLKPDFKCFDQSQIKIAGNYNSEITSFLDIRVYIKEEHCRNAETDLVCFGDREIEDNIRTYLFTLTNKKRFNQD